MRIGQGFDAHALKAGRKLVIGGVTIPHERGLDGHSDADVLLHAICDALLGALSLGDIGQHFPDTDAAYKGIDSKILLQRSYQLVCEKGYTLVNIDSTILLQAPKIRKYVDEMRSAIAGILNISAENVSIKATTTEQLSFIGREEGIVATANVLLQRKDL